jgi:hypothetical protein
MKYKDNFSKRELDITIVHQFGRIKYIEICFVERLSLENFKDIYVEIKVYYVAENVRSTDRVYN